MAVREGEWGLVTGGSRGARRLRLNLQQRWALEGGFWRFLAVWCGKNSWMPPPAVPHNWYRHRSRHRHQTTISECHPLFASPVFAGISRRYECQKSIGPHRLESDTYTDRRPSQFLPGNRAPPKVSTVNSEEPFWRGSSPWDWRFRPCMGVMGRIGVMGVSTAPGMGSRIRGAWHQ